MLKQPCHNRNAGHGGAGAGAASRTALRADLQTAALHRRPRHGPSVLWRHMSHVHNTLKRNIHTVAHAGRCNAKTAHHANEQVQDAHIFCNQELPLVLRLCGR